MRFFAYLLAVFVLFALADTSVAQDRYSSSEATPPAPATAKALGLRLLSWPGKATPAAAPARLERPVQPRAPDLRAATPAPALPTSIYDPAPAKPAAAATPAPTRQPVRALAQAAAPASSGYPTARFYSLHRAYGETPDPVPLGPQFFASSSPDLAAPPPPSPRTVTTTSGRIERTAPSDPGVADLAN